MPEDKIYKGNCLARLLWKLVSYNLDSEYKHYLECLSDQGDDEAMDALEEKDEYNSELIPGHIYHTLRYVKEMIECYERESGDSSFRSNE